MLQPDQKERELRRWYWQMLVLGAFSIALTAIFALVWGPRTKAHPVGTFGLILIFAASVSTVAWWHGHLVRKKGITSQEMKAYLVQQPLYWICMVVMLITVVLKLIGSFK